MAILKIAQMGEPVLRRRAEEVDERLLGSVELRSLVEDMVETMRDADGAGIAAPQVYVSRRICIVEIQGNPRYPDFPHMPLTVFVNPVVTPLVPNPENPKDEDTVSLYEGCLSVSGIRGRVKRPRRVHVESLDATGKRVEFELEGFLASVIQHEVDHLDGTLFIDRAEPATLAFLREYERYVPPASRFTDGATPPSGPSEHASRGR